MGLTKVGFYVLPLFVLAVVALSFREVLATLLTHWDILLFILLVGIHILAWLTTSTTNQEPTPEARTLGATTLTSTTTAGITAVSILIPASLVIVQLGSEDNKKIPEPVLDNLFHASLWFLISLACGVFIVYLVPLRASNYNVATYRPIGFLLGPQMWGLLVGIVCMVRGLYLLVSFLSMP